MMPHADIAAHSSIKMWLKSGMPSNPVGSRPNRDGEWLPMGEVARSWGAAEWCRLIAVRCRFGWLKWL
jgi:hypothetical protein